MSEGQGEKKDPYEICFFQIKPSWWRRHAVIGNAGDQFEVIARFWSWDRADDLVDRLARLMAPIYAAELSDRIKRLAE